MATMNHIITTMNFFFDVFVLLLVCNQVTPYFAVGETFGFSSLEEPSWSSSVKDNAINDERSVDDIPGPPTMAQSTTVTLTTTLPTTPPQRTTKRPRVRPKLPKGKPARTLPDEVSRENPRIAEPDQNEDRLQIVNTILAFKNIVRSIESDMEEVKQTCEVCSVIPTVDEISNTISESVCESSKTADGKIKQQLRDLKSSMRSIDERLILLTNTVNTLGVQMSGVQPRDCMDLFMRGQTGSGVFYIQPIDVDRSFLTYCDMTDGGGWTIIQKRAGYDTDFNRGMGSYRRGFGEPNYSHWMGLDKMHSLLFQDEYQLRIEIQLYDGRRFHAYYKYFKIGDYNSHYELSVGNYNGTAGDALTFHNGMLFTTKDRDHDRAHGHNCATIYKGGWWYGDCLYANLNGVNIGKEETDSSAVGIIWYDLTGFHSSLQYTTMAVRPTS